MHPAEASDSQMERIAPIFLEFHNVGCNKRVVARRRTPLRKHRCFETPEKKVLFDRRGDCLLASLANHFPHSFNAGARHPLATPLPHLGFAYSRFPFAPCVIRILKLFYFLPPGGVAVASAPRCRAQ